MNLAAGVVIFIVGLRWASISSYLSRERNAFARMYGRRAAQEGQLTITLDTFRDLRLLPQASQQALNIHPIQVAGQRGERFFKTFPDGHITWFPGPKEELVPYASARAAGYVLEALRSTPGVRVRIASDAAIASEWQGSFLNLGSSASNVKTDDIKHSAANTWLKDDLGIFSFKDGRPDIGPVGRSDRGVILKSRNPYFDGYMVIVCAGLGEWGTSGAAWYLARNWRWLSRRFGSCPFLLVVDVVIGTDQSAHEILAIGRESALRRFRAWVRSAWAPPPGS